MLYKRKSAFCCWYIQQEAIEQLTVTAGTGDCLSRHVNSKHPSRSTRGYGALSTSVRCEDPGSQAASHWPCATDTAVVYPPMDTAAYDRDNPRICFFGDMEGRRPNKEAPSAGAINTSAKTNLPG